MLEGPKKKLAFTAALVGFLGASVSLAQDQPVVLSWDDKLGFVRNVHINLVDNVSDNCWTNATAIRSRMRLLFEQNEIAVHEEPFAFPDPMSVHVTLQAIGYRVEGSDLCAVSSVMSVSHAGFDVRGGAEGRQTFSLPFESNLSLQFGVNTSSSNVNEALSDFFEGTLSDFVADVISARRSENVRHFFDLYPAAGIDPISRTAWASLVEAFELLPNSD
jgi:hypothetical protein